MKPGLRLSIELPGALQGGAARGDGSSVIELLSAVDRMGSLQQAAQSLGLSYRHAWGQLKRCEASLGRPLLQSVRGHGATLSPAGRRLLDAQAWLQAESAGTLAVWQAQLQALLCADESQADLAQATPAAQAASDEGGAKLPNRADAAPLRISASSDDLLADWCQGLGSTALTLDTRGAADALARLHEGQADVAGLAISDLYVRGSIPHVMLRRWMHDGQVRLLHLAWRSEGVVMARAQPLPLGTLAAAVRSGLRWCNRQRSSSARWLFDLYLDRERIPAAQVRGYEQVCYTQHEAVARLMAGDADMMWGPSALAARQGWQFMPLVSLRCLLVVAATPRGDAVLQRLQAALRAADFAAVAARHPGHDVRRAGEEVGLAEALPWHPAALHMHSRTVAPGCATTVQPSPDLRHDDTA